MVTIDDLKRAIPSTCFKPTYTKSLFFLVRNLLVISAFGIVAWSYIPQIQFTVPRYVAWVFYGYIQRLAFTGFWVICFWPRVRSWFLLPFEIAEQHFRLGHPLLFDGPALYITGSHLLPSSITSILEFHSIGLRFGLSSRVLWQQSIATWVLLGSTCFTTLPTTMLFTTFSRNRIPHYYAKEATEAIRPLLGKQYHEERGNFNAAMWNSFHKCQWVKADDVEDEKERAYWFKAGPIPPPERDMKKRAWI
ncbi:hypothetical protein HBI16_213930 [Parastagonospora nodorum]|nr:hypothetical protein HBI16_213930 [Parastagonospora nodorum]